MLRVSAMVMGMPALIQVVDRSATKKDAEAVFKNWRAVDRRFSPFKKTSELGKLNRGEISPEKASAEMKEVLALAEQTKKETNGYFNIRKSDGQLDPSGLVKGWAIWNGAKLLKEKGYRNFYVEIAGDIQLQGTNEHGQPWRVGIRQPLAPGQMAEILELSNVGVATSGSYLQAGHIYNPIGANASNPFVSLTVIGPNIYEADRLATAAFAMGERGLGFIEDQPALEGYGIYSDGQARATSGFWRCTAQRVTSP